MASWKILILCIFMVVKYVYAAAGTQLSILEDVKSTAALQKILRQLYVSKSIQPAESTSIDLDRLSEPCRNQTAWMQSNLFTNDAAMQMYDSSTKIPEGLLYADFVHLGNFDECIAVRDVDTGSGKFNGKHCLAAFSTNIQLSRAMLIVYLSMRPLKIAQCVPSTCTTDDVAIIAMNSLTSVVSFPGVELESLLQVEVDELECHTSDKPDYQPEDYVAIVVLSIFGLLVVGSTCYDVLRRNAESRSNLIAAFSIYSNGKKLFATSKGGDTLHCVHGIRFLSMAWVVLGHTYMHALSTAPASNLLVFANNAPEDWKYMHITNGTVSVDTFFVLSGLLVAYVFFKTVPKTNSFNVPMYYIHRYIRLTPAYAISIFLVTTLWMYSGSGPLFDAIAAPQKQSCVDYWWTNLLYVQNYANPMDQCLSQAWYLAVDMQLYWFSPLVLVPLWKWPRIGWAMMGVLTLAGIVSNFVISQNFEFYGSYFMNVRGPTAEDYSTYMYFPAHARFVPYLIGVALGYMMADIKNKNGKIEIPKLFVLAMWMLAVFLMLFTFYIVLPFQQTGYVNNVVEGAFYNALGRPGWSLGVALIIFLCATGYGGFANSLLSWDWFQVLGRLTYSIYLVHMNVQLTRFGSERSSIYLGGMVLIPRFASDLMISLVIAVPMALVFESPFIILEKELFGGKKKPAPRSVETPTAPMEDKRPEETTEIQAKVLDDRNTSDISEQV